MGVEYHPTHGWCNVTFPFPILPITAPSQQTNTDSSAPALPLTIPTGDAMSGEGSTWEGLATAYSPEDTGKVLDHPVAKSVEDSRANWAVSPTQLETLEQCQRKFGWQYIAGIKSPQTDATALGDRTHKELERYLLTGELPNQDSREGQIATAGLHLLPEPMTPGLEVETKLRFISPQGNRFNGRKDYTLPPGVRGPAPVIGDHKTTKDWKYVKTPEQLTNNIQALVYAADAMIAHGSDSAELEWTYYRTKGKPDSRQVRLTLYADEVEKRFGRIDELANTIHHIRATCTDVQALPANVQACEDFGGCPHRFRCNLSPLERNQAVLAMANNPSDPNAATNALLADLAARSGQGPALPGLPGIPTAAPAPPPGAPAPMSALDALRAKQAAMQAAAPAPAIPAPAIPAPVGPMVAGMGGLPIPVGMPTMPGFPAAAPPPPAPMTVGQAAPELGITGPAASIPLPPPPVAPPPPPPPAPAPETAAPPPMPTPGTWFTHTDGNNYYPCHCGNFLSVDMVRASNGKCQHCTRDVAGASIFVGPMAPPAINPPESRLPPPAPAPAVETVALPAPDNTAEGEKKKRGRKPLPRDEHGNIIRPPSTPAMAAVTPAQVAAHTTAAPPPMPAPAAPPAPSTVVNNYVAPPPAPAPAPSSSTGEHPIRVLLVDTLPIGGSCCNAEVEVFAPCRAAVAKIHGVEDYRMLDFGKGPGVFAAAVKSWLENSGKTWDCLYVDSRTADAMHVLPILVAHADKVFRGMA